ncbi:MAG: ABC transporter ATP-binding protein/permease, partial [Fibrobacter sp.]|nr:ABC transporter ATP-binding protein/permease [Fibrobacter sp.]
MSTFGKLSIYMESRKPLFPFALIFSAVSAALGIVPFIYVWLLVRELFSTTGTVSADLVKHYAFLALIFSVLSVIIYFAALVCSHLVAFRVEGNIRRATMEKLLKMPLGFFDKNSTGNIRKIIDDNAAITHTFLAHQLPDLAGTLLVPIAALTLMFVFDWRLGLASLIPIVYAVVML